MPASILNCDLFPKRKGLVQMFNACNVSILKLNCEIFNSIFTHNKPHVWKKKEEILAV
jgi:hypothetical protein